VISQNDYWKNNRTNGKFLAFNSLKDVKPELKIESTKSQNDVLKTSFIISNPTDVPALAIKLNLKDIAGKEIMLPAYFSDGYFTLLPGESKKLNVEYPAKFKDVEIAISGYNIGSTKNIRIAYND
jgi:hypothetical protein